MLLPQQLKTSVFLPWGQRGKRQSLILKLEENVVKKGQNGCGSCQKGECSTLFKPQVQLSLWSAARVCICPCAVCVCEMCVSKCLGACVRKSLWEWIPELWLQGSSSLWSGELWAPITSTHRTGEKSHIHPRHTAAHQSHAYPLFSTLLWLHCKWTCSFLFPTFFSCFIVVHSVFLTLTDSELS